jgi:PleD family two-component response regulator
MMKPAARILVVEDDSGTAEFLSSLLAPENYQVTTAEDGASGLLRAQRDRPDLILLDVLLPGMNGFEVCQRLRQDPATAAIPIILLTALGETKDKITGLKLGADDYVPKPFDASELAARIERALRRAREGRTNPLTGLPGVAALEEEIRRRLVQGEPFTVGRLDIGGLGRFNEVFGYGRGDHVVRLTGLILKSALAELADPRDPAVHFGADDFGFLASPARAEVVAARALENAEALFLLQYQAGVPAPTAAPPIALTFGLVDVFPGGLSHTVPILEEADNTLREARRARIPLLRRPAKTQALSQ